MTAGVAIGPDAEFKKMHHHQGEKAFDRVHFGSTQGPRSPRLIGPVHIVLAFPASEAAKQACLVLRPSQDVTFVETIRHGHAYTDTTMSCQRPWVTRWCATSPGTCHPATPK